jgi:uncharacterized membrane protein YkvA (DUF1232 family)
MVVNDQDAAPATGCARSWPAPSHLRYPVSMTSRRRTIAAVFVAIGAIVYGISPIDVIPELFTGPLGFTDDIAVLIGAALGIRSLLLNKRPPKGTTEPPYSQ